MSWDNPPAAVSALRDMIVACASAVSAGLVQANFHYPTLALGSDDTTTPDARPMCVIAEDDSHRTPYAEPGVAGLPGGLLFATLYSDDLSTGEIEELADNIVNELLLSVSGLPNISASRQRASEPTPGQLAADDTAGNSTAAYSGITISITYGLRA